MCPARLFFVLMSLKARTALVSFLLKTPTRALDVAKLERFSFRVVIWLKSFET